MVILVNTELLGIVKRESVFFYSIILRPTQDVISSYYVQLLKNIMGDEYITPDRNHSALLIIDVQCDFTLIGAVAEIPGTLTSVSCIKRLVQGYRKVCLPIVHVIRLYSKDGSNVDLCRRKAIENGKQLVIPGSDGAELMDELKPFPHIRLDSKLLLSGNLQQIGSMEWIMYKPRWGAFYNTKLERHLQNLDVNTVVVCGCNFPNCPRTTIYEASERDYRIVLATDATSVLYDRALQELKNIDVLVMNTDECIEWLGAPSHSPSHSRIQDIQ